jgi:hypothetical protein
MSLTVGKSFSIKEEDFFNLIWGNFFISVKFSWKYLMWYLKKGKSSCQYFKVRN